MISKINLIDIQDLKDSSPIVGDYNYDYLSPFIKIAQDLDISEITGEALLNKIYAGVIGSSLSADETKLLEEYIKPALVHYTLYRGMDFMSVRANNSGIERRDSQTGTSLDLNETSFLATKEKTIAESYGSQLQDYIEAREDSFPEYNLGVDGQIKPTAAPSYSGGLYLGIRDSCDND